MPDIIETFGGVVASTAASNPQLARRVMLTGYHAQHLKLTVAADRRLPPARRYIARVVMELVIKALEHPKKSAAVSLFTPCEPLFAAGINPYSVETLSAFLSGTRCESAFLQIAADEGLPETMCSYHRAFLGALENGLAPSPAFTVYTSLVCDGNMVTFPHIQRHFDIPGFCVDVPYEKSEDSVAYVARRLQDMTHFVEDITGKRVTDAQLSQRVASGIRAGQHNLRVADLQRTRYLSSDLTSEMYAVLTNHVLLGSPAAETFARLLEHDIAKAPESDHTRLLWMHLIPNMQPAVTDRFDFTDHRSITACDLAIDPFLVPVDASKPYDAMARRLVYSAFNGTVDARVERALHLAERTGAQGAVLFAQWGCKSTLGSAQLIKRKLEEAGLPCLVLDGDGCDRSNAGDGQTATRLEAFLEMIDGVQGEEQPDDCGCSEDERVVAL